MSVVISKIANNYYKLFNKKFHENLMEQNLESQNKGM